MREDTRTLRASYEELLLMDLDRATAEVLSDSKMVKNARIGASSIDRWLDKLQEAEELLRAAKEQRKRWEWI